MHTLELMARLAADLLDALAAAASPLPCNRAHPRVSEAESESAFRFWAGHGVAGLVLRIYDPVSLSQALGAEYLTRLQQIASESQYQALRLLAVLRPILALAASAGIAVAPFKGPTEAQLLYGDAGVRSTSDLDLLVSPHHLDDLLDHLKLSGWMLDGVYADMGPWARRWYRHTNHALVLRSVTGVALDLHWRVNEYPLLKIDESRWLEDGCLPARFAGQSAWQLKPEARYLALLSHAARSEWFLLKWWADLVRARQLAVLALGEAGLMSVLQATDAVNLDLAWQQAWSRMRQGVLPQSGETGFWLLSEVRPDPRQYFAHMWHLRQNLYYRWVLCWREAVRWDDFKRMSLPDALFPVYFFVRLPLMAWRRVVTILASRRY